MVNLRGECIGIEAKDLANMLKKAVGECMAESQSVFIEGRLISYNVLVASEVNHYLKRKRQGKMGITVLKVDMSKAYDSME